MKQVVLVALTLFALCGALNAAVPRYVHFQGFLTDDGGNPLSGTYTIVFRIYDIDAGGAPLWEETHNSVDVTNGCYDVTLGMVTALTLPFDAQYYLALEVDSDGEMSPRYQMCAAPYAIRAATAEDADTVDGIHAATTPTADHLLPLDAGGMFPASVIPSVSNADNLNGQGGSYYLDWLNLTNVPLTFPPETHQHPWSDITGTPATYPPSAHSHNATDITSGTLSTSRFSAYSDLQAEAKIGTGSTQVATGDHAHAQYLTTEADTLQSVCNRNRVVSNSMTGSVVNVSNTSASGNAYGVFGSSSSSSGRGVYGNCASGYGVFGSSTTGFAVYASGRLATTTYLHAGSPSTAVNYHRFGSGTTGHSLTGENDVLVSGNIEANGVAYLDSGAVVTGNAQVSGNFTYSSAKTYYLNLHAAAFVQGYPDWVDEKYYTDYSWGGYVVPVMPNDGLYYVGIYASVELPQGATVTEFRVYGYDNKADSNGVINAYLRRRSSAQAGYSSMASTVLDSSTWGADASVHEAFDNTIFLNPIDNGNNQYFIYVRWSFDSTPTPPPDMFIRFYGCRITYTLSTVSQ